MTRLDLLTFKQALAYDVTASYCCQKHYLSVLPLDLNIFYWTLTFILSSQNDLFPPSVILPHPCSVESARFIHPFPDGNFHAH